MPLLILSAFLVSAGLIHGASAVQLKAGSSSSSKAMALEADPRWNSIWTFWEYPNGPDPYVQLNLDTWRKNAPHMKVMFVNDSNIRDYVPDLPEEYFRLPYASAKSDFIRAALLYHQGGVYMDTDFLLMKPLHHVLEKLETHDVVSYGDDDHPTGECGDHFSSNFMAGRKGNAFSKTWWLNIRAKLTRTCAQGEFGCEKVCCHEEGAKQPETRQCHIPWAQLEHLKIPKEDADRAWGGPDLDRTKEENRELVKKGHTKCRSLGIGKKDTVLSLTTKIKDVLALDLPKDLLTHCFRQNQSMTPHLVGELYWAPWNKKEKVTMSVTKGLMKFEESHYDKRFRCVEVDGGHLKCHGGYYAMNDGNVKEKTVENFFGRTAYHLFFSSATTIKPNLKSKQEVLDGDWILSELYRRALGL